MTSAQSGLVRDSFDQVRHLATPITMLFYGRLFDLDPDLRRLFHTEIPEQSKKLAAMLTMLVDSLDCFEKIAPELRELGRRHVAYGVRPENYRTLTAALLWAFSQALQPEFTPEVREAWAEVIEAVNSEMLKGVDWQTA